MKTLNLECTEGALDCIDYRDGFALYSHVDSDLVYADTQVTSPKITLALPTYNTNRILEALESAINQKNAPEYEIIVIDNNSTKSCVKEIIAFAKERNTAKISVYVNKENIGMYGNWNRCIELAKAPYIVFLHSDDLLTDSCLSDLWEAHLTVEPEACIVGKESITYMDGRVVSTDKIKRMSIPGIMRHLYLAKRVKLDLLAPHGNGCGHFFNVNVLKEIGGYGPGGDQGCILNYNLKYPIYDFNKITRIKRIGENESTRVAESFRAYGYFQRIKVIDRCFNGNKLLHYYNKLDAENVHLDMYGVKPLRRLHIFEKAFIYLFRKYREIRREYEFF